MHSADRAIREDRGDLREARANGVALAARQSDAQAGQVVAGQRRTMSDAKWRNVEGWSSKDEKASASDSASKDPEPERLERLCAIDADELQADVCHAADAEV